MAQGSSCSEEYKPLDTILDTWNVEVKSFISHHFSNDVATKFEAEDIDGDSLMRLLRKLHVPDDLIFAKLGLSTFGKLCKFRKITESLLPCDHLGNSISNSRSSTPSSSIASLAKSSLKPSLSEIATYSKDIQLLYKAKRGRIQRAAVQQWPGNHFPNFRLAEEKTKLDELAASLEEECSIPEINFGFEGIKKHIESVFNERRRSRKRERIDYDLPDKRMSLKGKDNGKPPLPTMSEYDNEEVNQNNEDNDHISNDGSSGEFEGGDTDIVNSTSENSDGSDYESQPVLKKSKKTKGKKQSKNDFNQLLKKTTKLAKKNVDETETKEARSQSSILNPDQEVSAINLSSKSAKVLLMSYSGQSAIESISREYLCQIIKELGGKVSLAKQLQGDALFKAVAVKLVNHGRIKIKPEASLANLKRFDIIQK